MRIFKEKNPNEPQVEDIIKNLVKMVFKRPLFFITHLFACLYVLFYFFIICMFCFGFLLFFQEFNSSAQGKVVEVKSVHGGYDIYLDNDSEFHWILGGVPPEIGDYFNKQSCSFRYLVNGENAITITKAMVLTSIRIPPRYCFPLLVFLLLFQFFFYRKYKITVSVAFWNGFDYKKISLRDTPLFELAVIPIVLIIYSLQFFLMFFWV
jgi:hypothetical protein